MSSTKQVHKTRRIPKVTRFFYRMFSSLRHRIDHRQAVKNRLPLTRIRQSLESLMLDCDSLRAQQVVYRIKMARTPAELWDLRCDMHQCIARVHDQTEASRRINTLVPVFRGWVPPGKLTCI